MPTLVAGCRGTSSLLTPLGWLTLYHGIGGTPLQSVGRSPRPRYCAGVLILDRADPRRILYRSPEPSLAPDTAEEREGIVDNVVFPTAVDARG